MNYRATHDNAPTRRRKRAHDVATSILLEEYHDEFRILVESTLVVVREVVGGGMGNVGVITLPPKRMRELAYASAKSVLLKRHIEEHKVLREIAYKSPGKKKMTTYEWKRTRV